jgi:hypothetical protein
VPQRHVYEQPAVGVEVPWQVAVRHEVGPADAAPLQRELEAEWVV